MKDHEYYKFTIAYLVTSKDNIKLKAGDLDLLIYILKMINYQKRIYFDFCSALSVITSNILTAL